MQCPLSWYDKWFPVFMFQKKVNLYLLSCKNISHKCLKHADRLIDKLCTIAHFLEIHKKVKYEAVTIKLFLY